MMSSQSVSEKPSFKDRNKYVHGWEYKKYIQTTQFSKIVLGRKACLVLMILSGWWASDGVDDARSS